MLLNPLNLFAALLGRLLDRVAPQPKPRLGLPAGGQVLAFERRPRSASGRTRASR